MPKEDVAPAGTPEDDFGGAFAEPGTDPAPGATGATGAAAPVAPATPAALATPAAPAQPTPSPAPADPTAAAPAKSEPDKDVNHWRGKANWSEGQRVKEAEARKAAEEKAAKLEKDLAEAKKSGSAPAPAPATPAPADPFAAVADELPEFVAATKAAIAQAITGLTEQLGRVPTKEEVAALIDTKTAATVQTVAANAEEQHWTAIRSAHTDIDTLKAPDSPLFGWVASQPDYIQEGMAKVLDSGTANQVIDLISRFKKETNQPAKNDPPAPPAGISQAAYAVKTKPAAIAPGSDPGEGKFEDAFQEGA